MQKGLIPLYPDLTCLLISSNLVVLHLPKTSLQDLPTDFFHPDYQTLFVRAITQEIIRTAHTATLTDNTIHIWKSPFYHQIQKPDKISVNDDILGNNGFSDHDIAHIIRRIILSVYLNCSPAEVIIQYDLLGRPSLKIPYCGLSISSSYTRSSWTLAISPVCAIGVDIEDIVDNPDLSKISNRFFKKEESAYLSQVSEERKLLVWYQFWTVKEAYLKAMGSGFSGWEHLPDMTNVIEAYYNGNNGPIRIDTDYCAFLSDEGGSCLSVVFQESE